MVSLHPSGTKCKKGFGGLRNLLVGWRSSWLVDRTCFYCCCWFFVSSQSLSRCSPIFVGIQSSILCSMHWWCGYLCLRYIWGACAVKLQLHFVIPVTVRGRCQGRKVWELEDEMLAVNFVNVDCFRLIWFIVHALWWCIVIVKNKTHTSMSNLKIWDCSKGSLINMPCLWRKESLSWFRILS